MAHTIARTTDIQTVRITMDSNTDDATAVTIDSYYRVIRLQFYASNDSTTEAGFVSSAGTDSENKGTNWFAVPPGEMLTMRLSRGAPNADTVLYITGTTASGHCHVMASAD